MNFIGTAVSMAEAAATPSDLAHGSRKFSRILLGDLGIHRHGVLREQPSRGDIK